ncbi:MAG: hypothetical protein QF632_00745 [Candidatus Woesearchaeota archaeon]|jgi:hypothetical protein|nr:hypothetical protein [Candidatus Woesearchaeota archaeon]MDP7323268.1 hypothetical protein [Candidatus Woesearchaeota archaeon]MDP7457773.1 hypothetical protein [Candidatus Woesearchaeota archaeon]
MSFFRREKIDKLLEGYNQDKEAFTAMYGQGGPFALETVYAFLDSLEGLCRRAEEIKIPGGDADFYLTQLMRVFESELSSLHPGQLHGLTSKLSRFSQYHGEILEQAEPTKNEAYAREFENARALLNTKYDEELHELRTIYSTLKEKNALIRKLDDLFAAKINLLEQAIGIVTHWDHVKARESDRYITLFENLPVIPDLQKQRIKTFTRANYNSAKYNQDQRKQNYMNWLFNKLSELDDNEELMEELHSMRIIVSKYRDAKSEKRLVEEEIHLERMGKLEENALEEVEEVDQAATVLLKHVDKTAIKSQNVGMHRVQELMNLVHRDGENIQKNLETEKELYETFKDSAKNLVKKVGYLLRESKDT